MNVLLRHKWKIGLAVAGLAIAGYYATAEEDKVWVSVAGAHYFPPNHRVDEFYVNRGFFGNTSFDGYASMGSCCVWLPLRWRSGLQVEVRWVVGDWTNSPISDEANFDWNKLRLVGMYRAKVPVEPYEEPGDLFVHFFEGGKVRVVPGIRQFRDDSNLEASIVNAASKATAGVKIGALFTPQEEAENWKNAEEERRRGGR